MKIISVSDPDTNIMFELMGIDSYALDEEDLDLFKREFEKILHIPDLGVILLNEQYLVRFQAYFKEIKLNRLPIIVEIPNIRSTLNQDYYENFIQKMLNLDFLSATTKLD
jgi:vacuolar-type H+-ATPase subunit F/Vma7